MFTFALVSAYWYAFNDVRGGGVRSSLVNFRFESFDPRLFVLERAGPLARVVTLLSKFIDLERAPESNIWASYL